jgi:hypothetical protein
MNYRERVGLLADQYWHARWTHDVMKAKAIYEAMGNVPADELPASIHPELVELADRFAMKERGRRHDLDHGPWVCNGHWPFADSGLGLTRFLPVGWVEQEWGTAYVTVWTNDALDSILTYCEGDISLAIYWPKESYLYALGSARQFYLRQRSRA